MSAVLRWRCDICHREADVVQEVERGKFAFFHPKAPQGWERGIEGNLDICSQQCRVVHLHRVLDREQRRLDEELCSPGAP